MIMEITLLIMEKSWNFVFEYLWEPWSELMNRLVAPLLFANLEDRTFGPQRERENHIPSLSEILSEKLTFFHKKC